MVCVRGVRYFALLSCAFLSGFEVFQQIPTKGAVDAEFFTVDGLHLLAIANHGGNDTVLPQTTFLLIDPVVLCGR